MSDADCAERARDGDRMAFAEIVRRYQDRVFRFVVRMVDSREDALELTQDAFVKAWQALPGWHPRAAFHTWLFQIARNGAIDHLRRRKLVAFVAEYEPDPAHAPSGEGPEQAAILAQDYRRLELALQSIAPEHREILLLREVEQLSYEELADTLGIPTGTAKSRLSRARSALLSASSAIDKEPT